MYCVPMKLLLAKLLTFFAFSVLLLNWTAIYWIDVRTALSFDDGYKFFQDKKVVRIKDIKVIAALGDSILAGYAASNIPFVENRGLAFVTGEAQYTIASQFSLYSDIVGTSYGSHLVQICHGAFCPGIYFDSDGLDAAMSGSLVSNLDKQVTRLINVLGSKHLNDYKVSS